MSHRYVYFCYVKKLVYEHRKLGVGQELNGRVNILVNPILPVSITLEDEKFFNDIHFADNVPLFTYITNRKPMNLVLYWMGCKNTSFLEI